MQEVSCYSENGTSNDGSIDLTVTGGTVSGAYTYEWEALSGSGVSPSAQDQFTLTTGEYSVTVTDDNLCQVFDTSIIAGPGPILFSGTLVTPATGGASDGAIDLTVTGGNDASPYSYLWDDGPTTEDRTAIPGGDYTVTVTDILSCQADTTLIVEDATLFIAFISDKTNVDCKGNSSGSATVSTSGGVEPYSYAWENSVGNPIPGDNTITDVPKGTYYVTVTDDIGSTASTSVQITEPAQVLSTSIVGSDLQCYGDNSGILDLTVTGGTLPYSFSWSNGVTTEDQVGIPASTYTVTVTDARNCTEINSKDVNQPPAMGINITIDAQIMCYGDLTGIVTATATGGTGTFSYQWDDPGAQNTQQATELEAGTYHVTATDLAGCEVSSQILLTQPAALTLSATPQDISCFGEEDGQINLLTPAGGTPPYYYDWSNGAISQDIEDLSAGTYSVTVTDAHNCIAYLESEISEPEEVTIAEIVTGNASCQGYTDGQIVVTGQGGNGSYQYSVDNGNSYSSSNTFTDLAAGNYSVVIMDGNDCESAISPVELTEPEGTTISSEEAMNISCNGLSDGSITLSASSPVGGLEYSIDEGETYLDNNGAFAGLEGGSYQVWIRDADDCITQSSVLEIIEPEAISIDTSITQPGEGVSGTIRVFATGGTTPYDYYLLAGENEVSNSDGNFSDLLSGDYSVWIIDVNLCESDTLQVILNPYTSSGLIIYNAFSPNADGVNDTWTIGNISMYPDCIVTIMNTWGNKVFTSDGYPEPWDGTYNDKELPAGTYYYIIDLGDGSDPLSGPVSIVR